MTIPEMQWDKAACETRSPAECIKQSGQDHELGWFAFSPVKEEITQEMKTDIKAFLDFVQAQNKPAKERA